MASAPAYEECDERSQTTNIVCCLKFLVNEAENAELPIVSKIIGNAVARIVSLNTYPQQQDMECDFVELACALKKFMKFYLLGTHAARKQLIELIVNMDGERSEAYVH